MTDVRSRSCRQIVRTRDALSTRPQHTRALPVGQVVEANSASTSEKAQLVLWGGLYGVGKLSGGVRQAVEAVVSTPSLRPLLPASLLATSPR